MRHSDSLDELVRRTAHALSAKRRGAVVVGAIRGDDSAVHGADPATLFEIGSVSKTFTSLALATLVTQEQVSLQAPLYKLLPHGAAVPGRSGEPIRLQHLACHTSGLPKLPRGLMPRGLFSKDPYAGCTTPFLLDGLPRTRLRSTPGTRFHYSNLGAGLLGLALAHHTGQDYDTLIRTEVTDPLKLVDTAVALTPEQTSRLATGHNALGRRTPRWRLADLAGAGGIHSTVPDLLLLARAHLTPPADDSTTAPLAEAVRLTRGTAHPLPGGPSKAHPGWISFPLGSDGPQALFHNGGTGGYRSLLAVAPERQAAVVILSAQARSVDRAGLSLLTRLLRTVEA
ncbi:serine hydrolase domain-containing protein [Streptomyces alkaliterrae]|uniref:Beta-lactamase n=3 Tax=Streptomyces alkaliterrae TaxID=2213162 RepID=A0A7W3ZUV0_9ACTN|nr:serine hydrolase domain-containing protein [Streptomyces alkaliterrae]MBB1261220.1 beta-lactamase family protein [Streptomyces alkaliterrae]